jgi:CheY-like chemotaxis protein
MNELLSGRRVLVVEDEMMILMMIEDMLTDLGCETVIAATTVDRALELIDGEEFHAAMLDLNLKGESSYAVADALIARGVPFVFSTGTTDHNIREGYRDCSVLRKPFSQEKLAEAMTSLLAR